MHSIFLSLLQPRKNTKQKQENLQYRFFKSRFIYCAIYDWFFPVFSKYTSEFGIEMFPYNHSTIFITFYHKLYSETHMVP